MAGNNKSYFFIRHPYEKRVAREGFLQVKLGSFFIKSLATFSSFLRRLRRYFFNIYKHLLIPFNISLYSKKNMSKMSKNIRKFIKNKVIIINMRLNCLNILRSNTIYHLIVGGIKKC